uniref:Uncharacterized protein n=1 Tax=Anguilla anguilla TaxID=7936 RepID=A0A0E9TZI4_ANGAN
MDAPSKFSFGLVEEKWSESVNSLSEISHRSGAHRAYCNPTEGSGVFFRAFT